MKPKGSIFAHQRICYRLLMGNNNTTPALPGIKHAQIAAKMHTQDQQTLTCINNES
jgi:hypothetical protein